MNVKNTTAVAVAVLASLLASVSRAAPSVYLAALNDKHLKSGWEATSVAVLKPAPAAGREAIAKDLLSRLDGRLGKNIVAKDLALKESGRSESLFFLGEAAYLEVFGDGSHFRFRSGLNRPIEPAASKITEKDLETLGRAFIGSLGDLVKAPTGESITFLGSRYLRTGDTDLNGKLTQDVAASIALFGREVNGVPVVGKGSKIAVWFDAGRNPVAFDVDWPQYEATPASQAILPWEELKERVEAATIPLAESSSGRVTRFVCGYVDQGASKRGDLIQAGCSVTSEGRSAEGYRWGRIDYVPAGVEVLEDPQWRLAGGLSGSGKDPGAGSGSADFKLPALLPSLMERK